MPLHWKYSKGRLAKHPYCAHILRMKKVICRCGKIIKLGRRYDETFLNIHVNGKECLVKQVYIIIRIKIVLLFEFILLFRLKKMFIVLLFRLKNIYRNNTTLQLSHCYMLIFLLIGITDIYFRGFL